MRRSIVVGGMVAVVAAQNPSAVSKISSLQAELASELSPPQSIIPDLLKYVPSTVIDAFADPTLLPVIASEVANNPPAWLSSLPPAAYSYLVNAEGAYDSIEPQITSLEALVTGVKSTFTPTFSIISPTVTSTGFSNSTSSTSVSSITTKAASLTSSAASSSSSAASSSRSGGSTNEVAAGVLGAVGILGLALAL